METKFDIPIVLFIFKRKDTVLQIIEQLRIIKPQKIYLIADAGRNNEENLLVSECRKAVEKAIDWDCMLIKNYAVKNRGVHAQIGKGALWIFEKEDKAIFLEDDNLPAISFFEYCKCCLEKYEQDEDIFWICGTNYLQKCNLANNVSVFKSKHLMPCGWASWGDKFKKYYDVDLCMTDCNDWEKQLSKKYLDHRLYVQQCRDIKAERRRRDSGERYRSWDYHMAFSIRMQNLWGIVPKYNQIKNIGVDEFSTHGGNSMNLEMTKRFCGINNYELDFPLKLPKAEDLVDIFDKEIGKIILYPFKARMISNLREIFKLPDDVRLRHTIKYWLTKN